MLLVSVRGNHFTDDRSEAFGAQVDRKAVGADGDPLNQQPAALPQNGFSPLLPSLTLTTLGQGWEISNRTAALSEALTEGPNELGMTGVGVG